MPLRQTLWPTRSSMARGRGCESASLAIGHVKPQRIYPEYGVDRLVYSLIKRLRVTTLRP